MSNHRARPVLGIVSHMDEYPTRVLSGARDVLAEHGIPLIAHGDGPLARGARSPLLVSLLRETTPVGVIQLNSQTAAEQTELEELLASADLPVVSVGMQRPGIASVFGENTGAMKLLMAHLLDDRGARRPALVRGIPHHRDSIEREAAFRRALADRDLPVDEDLIVTGRFQPETTYEAMRELLARRRDFDAVVALNDMSAISAIAAMDDVGIRVPDDVAVTGFDNDASAAQYPGLTTIDQASEQQGEAAARLLIEQIADGRTDRAVVVPARLIIRGSTAPRGRPPITDEAQLIGFATADKQQLATQAASLSLSTALNSCWTVEQVVDVVATHLDRLGVTRCFLGLHDRRRDGEGAARVITDEATIVLAYTHGERATPPPHAIATHELLPEELAHELDDGILMLQPLAVLDRPLGYLLFEQRTGSAQVTTLMRTELSRAIDVVLTTRDMRAHAQMLERVVERRTRQLQAEVVTRQRAERELQRANAVLQRSAMLDGLTQIANRTAFDDHLARHWRSHSRDGHEMAIAMIDVDAFKLYNDHYGHLTGDEALRTVAECLQQAVGGPDDLVCRYGGEEFTAVLPRSGVDGAVAVSERFRARLADMAIPHASSPVGPTLTVSIGIAVGVPLPGSEPDPLLDAADRALYQAKAQGRDRIVVAASPHISGGQMPHGRIGSTDRPAGRAPTHRRPAVST